jgi:hypothetical protein
VNLNCAGNARTQENIRTIIACGKKQEKNKKEKKNDENTKKQT